MEKILIIPDIHCAYQKAQNIIKAEAPDKIICLGDYFDQFHDTAEENKKTAIWLKALLKQDNVIALKGNHDVNYQYPPSRYTTCSGFTRNKWEAINEILLNEDWAKLKWFHFEQGILFTHAGLHPRNIPPLDYGLNLEEWLKTQIYQAEIAALDGYSHWFFAAGRARGGSRPIGGLVWCDFDVEFEGVPDLRQVVGHTPRKVLNCDDAAFYAEYGKDKDNICLDTHLNHYGILLNGQITIKAYKDL
jgi:hypothetical protein